nr:probable nucleoside diphosphate kinase 5 isoform X1 [Tanacetum cinerariifolium]
FLSEPCKIHDKWSSLDDGTGKTNAIADWRALIGPTDACKAKVTHPD